ncbi:MULTISPECIES: Clp protease N-terminal domain-containing protein [unclassified Streptomyces]|uniref:Clp protease N-terminal domain-containing protein n=1 Tax=unclassified Streptomyces TaxID=2593676 RepID=UPI002E282B60|nr:Clp protease N-terminal domain-containing protein [Streptomyces sp. NBC_00223]
MNDTASPARLKPVLDLAREEADLRGDRRIGTDHLLLALLRDDTAPPARALGVTVAEGRTALDSLDRAALASLGIVLDAPLAPPPVRGHRRLPFNSAARAAVGAAKREAEHDHKGRRIEPRHLLLALLTARHPDPAADLLTALGLSAPAVRERLAAC